MQSVIGQIEEKYKKARVVGVRSGDTVKVHQQIREGGKERIQVFQGVVIRVNRTGSLSSRITVRRITSGVGVEKSFLLHSPLVIKVEVIKRSRTRRNYLTYLRQRTGKSARLTGIDFDHASVNDVRDAVAEKLAKEETVEQREAEMALSAEEIKQEVEIQEKPAVSDVAAKVESPKKDDQKNDKDR